ncbi:efflux RND transporter periplasmic adaptor subunit [Aquibium oceanicum]|uniref:Efflux transporter periplasmic adaptor subunit n=1 Tax=Aquibium oceanicum TaxID=1670800 RepID=A0A1L3SS84_9HYPH|nr:efflux RND transporter periplasmic adaptor subunit [Aquibium oceanicum]APH72220.1 efflux transporter periplasmic adaptor subunit [Aquibium oceanicum]
MDQIVERPKPAETPTQSIEDALGMAGGTRRRGRRWVWLVLLLFVAAAGAYAWWSASSGSGDVVAYQTVPAARGDLTVEITATGTLQPLTQVDVSSELSGVVRAVPVRENQTVAKGDVLAELDTTRLSAQVERAEASLQAAEAKLNEARTTLKETEQTLARTQSLSGRGMVTEQALEGAVASRDRANSAVATAQANVAIAAADLKLQRADLAKSTIYAPIDGIVLTRDVDPGQTVASSLSAPVLFVIAENLETMIVEAAIDEADIGAVAKGQDARFTVDAFPNRRFDATISDISFASVTTEGVVTYDARLAVDNSDLALRPGMTATVSVVTREANDVVLVPSAAFRFRPPAIERDSGGFGLQDLFGGRRMSRIFERRQSTVAADGSRTLYVLRDGQPTATSVRTGSTDGENTEILSGLEEGDLVVTGTGQPGARARR